MSATRRTEPNLLLSARRPLLGIVQVVLASWALSGLDASGKWVMGAGVSLVVLCWVRYVVHLLLVLALILPAHGLGVVRSKSARNQLLRGGFMLASTLSMFTTLSYLPQAQTTAINFLAPLIVLALAPWLLGEPSRVSRWLAAFAGFAGVLLVIRPGAGLDPVGTLFGLLTATLFAGQYMTTRLVASDDSLTTLIWSGAVGSVALSIALPFALMADLPILASMTPLHWLVLISTGFWGALGHLLQIRAYQNASASMLSPFLYLQIIAAAGLGWLIWGQFPDALSWLGIGVIVASGVLISRHEWRSRR